MDRGAWWATVHRVTKSQTQLKQLSMHTLGEAMGEAIVLIYSFLVPMEDGWILKLGSVCVLSHFICVQLFVTQWTVACQAPLSMGSSRQGYWSGLPFPSPGYLPNPKIKPRSPTSQADSLLAEPHYKCSHLQHV